MISSLIFSGIVTPDNIHDVFLHIMGILEGNKYSLSKEAINSSSNPITRTDQKLQNTTIKKVGTTSQIALKGDSGEIIILQLLNPLDPKRDPEYPYIEISAKEISILNQNRKGSKERILITINS